MHQNDDELLDCPDLMNVLRLVAGVNVVSAACVSWYAELVCMAPSWPAADPWGRAVKVHVS